MNGLYQRGDVVPRNLDTLGECQEQLAVSLGRFDVPTSVEQ